MGYVNLVMVTLCGGGGEYKTQAVVPRGILVVRQGGRRQHVTT